MNRYHEYFIIYAYVKNDKTYYGNCNALRLYEILTIYDVREIEREIIKSNNFNECVVINWRLLNE